VPLQAILVDIGVAAVVETRRSHPRLFSLLVESLLKQSQRFSTIWDDARSYRQQLLDSLRMVADDEKEERMTRWRAKQLLKLSGPDAG
jgi:hypothetical protein